MGDEYKTRRDIEIEAQNPLPKAPSGELTSGDWAQSGLDALNRRDFDHAKDAFRAIIARENGGT